MCDRSGCKVDSSKLIVGSDEPLGTRASLFRNSGPAAVADPCLTECPDGHDPRSVCGAGAEGTGDKTYERGRSSGADHQAGHRRRLPGRTPGQLRRRGARVPVVRLAVPDHAGRPGAAVGQDPRGRLRDGGPGAHAQRMGAAGGVAAGPRRPGGHGAARAVGRPAELLQQAHQDRPPRLPHPRSPPAAAPRRPPPSSASGPPSRCCGRCGCAPAW